MRSPTTGQILSATTGQPLSHSRPVRLTRQSYRLGFRIEDFDDTYAQARAALDVVIYLCPSSPRNATRYPSDHKARHQ